MEKFFKELFEYHYHCNQKLFHIIFEHRETTSDRSLQLHNHLVNAHHIWNHRIMGKNALYGVWDMHDLQLLENMDLENFSQSLDIIERYDLDSDIAYTNTKGEPFINKTRDILFHIINHSTHHRAQIGSEMKLNDIVPTPMDFIFYKR